jgi:nitrogen fixation protein FixH
MARTSIITGQRVTAWLVAFFGTVIAVNLLMAWLAIDSFSGTVVDNSYVASQHYNRWLQQGRAQRALGWQVQLNRARDDRIVLRLADRNAAPLTGVAVTAIARHPIGREPEQHIDFVMHSAGVWYSRAPLRTGRWQVQVALRRGTQRFDTLVDVP